MKIPTSTGNKPFVIDSNALLALHDYHDKWHSRAKEILLNLERASFVPLYFDCVMNETISVLARRTEEQKRSQDFQSALDQLLENVPGSMIEWISTETQRLYPEVIRLIRDTDGKLNFHDALIAIRCRELKIKFLFGFDHDFDELKWLHRIGDVSDIP